MNVLMLGWELPPLFSGGLGVATYGLVKSLRNKVKIKLIVPRSSPSSSLEDVDIIGLNRVVVSQLSGEENIRSLDKILEDVQRIPVSISPYHEVNKILQHQTVGKETIFQSTAAKEIQQFFSTGEVYGTEILRKVHLFAELVDQLAGSNFDVIHAHDWVTYSAGLKVKGRTGKPLVLHVHSLETDRAGETVKNEIYQLEKIALEQADKIIAVSRYTRDQIIRHYQIDADKIEVVHNGIETKVIVRKEHKLTDKIVVFLGRITNQKGPHFLLETANKVVKVYPNVKFFVAGTGDQFAHLLETTAYQKLGRKFIFAGFLPKDKVDELLAMADVYFMPSVSEPFGLTALEAAQHFVPGVLSKQSGASEVLTATLHADFWDTDKHANYIFALLKYNALHRELAKKSNDQATALTWDSAAAKVFSLYQRLLE
ncbi:MAG TPA: glycosyltransferase [Cyclobacteriaceae bacterium]|nr:glycosyltransferase [Cyclobacteriaceae bacterium]